MDIRIASSLAGILLLAGLHIYYDPLQRILSRRLPHWTSVAGGFAVGYVFLYMFPKLADYTSVVISENATAWEPLQYRLYFFAMLGFLSYQAAEFYRNPNRSGVGYTDAVPITAFCIYNMLIGYVIPGIPRPGILPVVLATIPIGLHIMGMNHMLNSRIGDHYRASVRWLLAASILSGWMVGTLLEIPDEFAMSVTAFVSGAIIINVISEELPDRGFGSLRAFMLGVIAFSVFMACIRSLPRIG